MKRELTRSRRTFLRGLSASIALPFLESIPTVAAAGSGKRLSTTIPPRRMAFIYIPNGVQVPEWTPEREGANWALSDQLAPLAGVK